MILTVQSQDVNVEFHGHYGADDEPDRSPQQAARCLAAIRAEAARLRELEIDRAVERSGWAQLPEHLAARTASPLRIMRACPPAPRRQRSKRSPRRSAAKKATTSVSSADGPAAPKRVPGAPDTVEARAVRVTIRRGLRRLRLLQLGCRLFAIFGGSRVLVDERAVALARLETSEKLLESIDHLGRLERAAGVARDVSALRAYVDAAALEAQRVIWRTTSRKAVRR